MILNRRTSGCARPFIGTGWKLVETPVGSSADGSLLSIAQVLISDFPYTAVRSLSLCGILEHLSVIDSPLRPQSLILEFMPDQSSSA